MNNEIVSQSGLRTNCATTETDCATRTVLLERQKLHCFSSKSFCFQEKQASRAKTSHSQALLVLKETKDLKEPKERGGKGMG